MFEVFKTLALNRNIFKYCRSKRRSVNNLFLIEGYANLNISSVRAAIFQMFCFAIAGFVTET